MSLRSFGFDPCGKDQEAREPSMSDFYKVVQVDFYNII